MSFLQTDSTTGLERLGREIVLILNNELNDEIANQQAEWDTLDQEFAAALGKIYVATEVEPIIPSHFHLGNIPSLIGAPFEAFPNIAVLAFKSDAGGEQDIDLYHTLSDTVHIEMMCKAGPYPSPDNMTGEGEELVNRRTQRTVDAVFAVMNRNPTLNGLVQTIEGPPVVEIFDVYKRHEKQDRGPIWWWQGAVLEYPITRLSRAY